MKNPVNTRSNNKLRPRFIFRGLTYTACKADGIDRTRSPIGPRDDPGENATANAQLRIGAGSCRETSVRMSFIECGSAHEAGKPWPSNMTIWRIRAWRRQLQNGQEWKSNRN